MYRPSRPFDFNPVREYCDVNTTENELTVNRAEPTAVLPHPLGLFISHPPAPILV
jgi:hypothetical protein